jgi:hypothetical protein
MDFYFFFKYFNFVFINNIHIEMEYIIIINKLLLYFLLFLNLHIQHFAGFHLEKTENIQLIIQI